MFSEKKLKACVGYNADNTVIHSAEKQIWASNTTFILAAIGSAIGLGNLWRFPYLCFKHGGALFFIPYLLCLFFLGIPMIMLEFSLGQILQAGNVKVWNKLHPRMHGIGLATCTACYLICIYYNVIISWTVVLFFSSFASPLPWGWANTIDKDAKPKGVDGSAGPKMLGKCDMPISQAYFYVDILKTYVVDADSNNCKPYDTKTTMGGASEFQTEVFLAQILVWVVCFICVFQGVKLSSKIVWITVPLPVFFVFIMVMNGFTLKNSDEGFRMYLKGYSRKQMDDLGDYTLTECKKDDLGECEQVDWYAKGDPTRTAQEVAPDITKKLQSAAMWSEACAQIFFTLSICIGVMISYSSYNPRNAPIITNGFTVAFCNSGFSFFAGFAVFSTVGYLYGMDSSVKTKVSSIGLAFVAYPAAIETMPAPNFWCLLLAITLFTLGIDSAFSYVEATVCVVEDSFIGKKLSKFVIALILCVVGSLCSTIFCFNWGFTFFDVVDHYLNVYLVLLMGILQAVAVSWIHCFEDSMKASKPATLISLLGYWVMLIPLPLFAYFVFPESSWVAIPIFWGWYVLITIINLLVAVFVSKITVK